MMRGTLLLAILTVRSSYANRLELPLSSDADLPDTLQWWIASSDAWRIRTYAIDRDVHIHQVVGNPGALLALAMKNNRKHFGGLIEVEHYLNFSDCCNPVEVQAEFQRIGLAPRLEITVDQFAFWKPDEARYQSQTTPPQR